LRLAGAVVAVPLAEELAFRGYLARRLTAHSFEQVSPAGVTWPALLGLAALFGLMHRDVLAGAAVGVLFGLAARRNGQLGDAVLAHAVTNALLAATVLAPGRCGPRGAGRAGRRRAAGRCACPPAPLVARGPPGVEPLHHDAVVATELGV